MPQLVVPVKALITNMDFAECVRLCAKQALDRDLDPTALLTLPPPHRGKWAAALDEVRQEGENPENPWHCIGPYEIRLNGRGMRTLLGDVLSSLVDSYGARTVSYLHSVNFETVEVELGLWSPRIVRQAMHQMGITAQLRATGANLAVVRTQQKLMMSSAERALERAWTKDPELLPIAARELRQIYERFHTEMLYWEMVDHFFTVPRSQSELHDYVYMLYHLQAPRSPGWLASLNKNSVLLTFAVKDLLTVVAGMQVARARQVVSVPPTVEGISLADTCLRDAMRTLELVDAPVYSVLCSK